MARIPPINRRIFRTPSAYNGELPSHPRDREVITAIDRARILRADATGAERVLWTSLRLMKRQGFHFRRQARIVPYIVDFACKGSRLIVELDGSQHGTAAAMAYDETRTAFLNSRGYRVLRFWNQDVLDNRDGVVADILRALTSPPVRFADDLPMLGR